MERFLSGTRLIVKKGRKRIASISLLNIREAGLSLLVV